MKLVWIDTLLAYGHLLAILSWTVFLASTAALSRPELLSPALLARLATVHRVAWIGGWLTVATGLARVGFGTQPALWYAVQPLLWGKLLLVAAMLVMLWRAGVRIRAWHGAVLAGGALPAADDVMALRKLVMRAAHLMLVLPLLAVMLTRGLLVL